MALAAEVDSPGNSATSKSMCAARLVECLEVLRSRVPEVPVEDRLDELAAQRDKRKAQVSV